MGLYLMGRGDIRRRQTRKSMRFFHTIWMDGALIKLLQFSLISRQGFEKSMKDFVIQAWPQRTLCYHRELTWLREFDLWKRE